MRPLLPIMRLALFVTAALLAALAATGCSGREERAAAAARELAPRIVLVTLDTLHVLMSGPYNEEIEYTPVLDGLAAEGVLFRRAYTTVPITLPSHAGLLTGRRPEELGVMLNGDVLGEEATTLGEVLAGAGYRTAAFTSLGVLRSRFNLGQGFERYDDGFGPGPPLRWYRTADEVAEAASGWIREAAAEPFFLWLHLSDPHEPYVVKDAPPDVRLALDGEPLGEWNLASKERHRVEVTLPPGRHRLTWTPLRAPREDDSGGTALRLTLRDPEALGPWLAAPDELPDGLAGALSGGEVALREPLTLELRNPGDAPASFELAFDGRIHDPPPSEVWEQYALEVAFADRQLGRVRGLLEELGLAEGTLWVVVSDHGEGLFRQGGILGHTDYGHEDQLRIVWMLAGAGLPAGRVVEEPVLIQDVLPTLLEVLGLEAPAEVTGLSQAGCWQDEGCATRAEWWAFGAKHSDSAVTAVAGYRPPFKLVWQRHRTGAYHLGADPWEGRNLARGFGRHELPEELAALVESVEGHRSALQQRLETRDRPVLDAEQREMLRSLGYLGN